MGGTFGAFNAAGTRLADPFEALSTTGAKGAVNSCTGATDMTGDSLILRAVQDAHQFHYGQKREFKEHPHMFHVLRVVGRVMLLPDVTVAEVTGTAWHDVAEDCCKDEKAQQAIFSLHEVRYGEESLAIMKGLTNPSTFSTLPKAERKKIDFAHIAKQSIKVKRIKCLDRIDNINETISDLMAGLGASPRWALDYAIQSEALAESLAGIDRELLEELNTAISVMRHVAHTIFSSQ